VGKLNIVGKKGDKTVGLRFAGSRTSAGYNTDNVTKDIQARSIGLLVRGFNVLGSFVSVCLMGFVMVDAFGYSWSVGDESNLTAKPVGMVDHESGCRGRFTWRTVDFARWDAIAMSSVASILYSYANALHLYAGRRGKRRKRCESVFNGRQNNDLS
ncbi:hypothetical protein Tco_0734798, partial [Tanacetum coccineum]